MGSVWGHVSISRATTPQTWPLGMPMREYFIGGQELGGFYQWNGDPEIQPNWEMKFMVDGNQSIFGSNRNDTAGNTRVPGRSKLVTGYDGECLWWG